MDRSSLTHVHPLQQLSIEETNAARGMVLANHPGALIDFRIITLQEPAKVDLVKYIDLEHAERLESSSPRPTRLARAHYDVIDESRTPVYLESIIDIDGGQIVAQKEVPEDRHASLTVYVDR